MQSKGRGRAGVQALVVRGALLSLALTLLSAAPAAAQQLDVVRFKPSPFAGEELGVRGAGADGGDLAGHVFLSFGRDPLGFATEQGSTDNPARVISNQLLLDVGGSFALHERFRLGAALALLPFASGERSFDKVLTPPTFALGDARVAARLLLKPRRGDGWGLGVDVDIGLPTASEGSFAGNEGVSGHRGRSSTCSTAASACASTLAPCCAAPSRCRPGNTARSCRSAPPCGSACPPTAPCSSASCCSPAASPS